MVYRVIGLMSGSSLDGLDIAYVELHETSGKWNYELIHAKCYPYEEEWADKLKDARSLSTLDYLLLNTDYGHYLGNRVNQFIEEYGLHYKIQLIASHGHTGYHYPSRRMTSQLGDGAAIAAVTGINVVSDLRSMDIALGGHGAPIVPIGEKQLLIDSKLFLNIGGIANISYNSPEEYIAFDVCPANRVLNLIAREKDLDFDDDGIMARSGALKEDIFNMLNKLEYYGKTYPKSLDNSFGTDVVFPMLHGAASTEDLLRTYVEHIAYQVREAVQQLVPADLEASMLVTGGGAHNSFLMERIASQLVGTSIQITSPAKQLIDFKEAVIMAFIGVLRWREENNVYASVTGASRDSIGGAVYIGQEA